MKKRKIIRIMVDCLALSLLSVLFSSGGVRAQPIVLTYANFPPVNTFPCVQMERWKTEVEKRTGGKVVIHTFPGGTLLNSKNMLDGVIAGEADIGCFCMAYEPGRFMVTNATGLPFDIPSARVGSLVLWDIYQKYKPAPFAKVKVITMFNPAPSNIMSEKPIRRLSDLKGLPLRASGPAAQALAIWGATPVGMPMPETPEALQKGIVKGLFTGLDGMKDFKYAEFCRYVTMTNVLMYPFAVVMNLNAWNKLPKDVQKVIDGLRVNQCEWTGLYEDNHVKEAMNWSIKNYNVQVINLSRSERAKWLNLLDPMIQNWAKNAKKKGLPAEAIISDIKASIKKHEK